MPVWTVGDAKTCAALAPVILLLISGAAFYTSVEVWHWTEALYFCATPISTVVFGDLAPQTEFGRIFMGAYIFVGVDCSLSCHSRPKARSAARSRHSCTRADCLLLAQRGRLSQRFQLRQPSRHAGMNCWNRVHAINFGAVCK